MTLACAERKRTRTQGGLADECRAGGDTSLVTTLSHGGAGLQLFTKETLTTLTCLAKQQRLKGALTHEVRSLVHQIWSSLKAL